MVIEERTMEILPVGSSPISSPSFVVMYDGKDNGFNWVSSWEAGMNDVFSSHAWPGGYDVLWFGEGEIVCSKCARDHYEETGVVLAHDIAGDNYGMGEHCGRCNEEIIAPCCVDCGEEVTTADEDKGKPNHIDSMFVRDEGDTQICRSCMAKLYAKYRSVKHPSRGTYTIMPNNPAAWWGGGTYRANWLKGDRS